MGKRNVSKQLLTKYKLPFYPFLPNIAVDGGIIYTPMQIMKNYVDVFSSTIDKDYYLNLWEHRYDKAPKISTGNKEWDAISTIVDHKLSGIVLYMIIRDIDPYIFPLIIEHHHPFFINVKTTNTIIHSSNIIIDAMIRVMPDHINIANYICGYNNITYYNYYHLLLDTLYMAPSGSKATIIHYSNKHKKIDWCLENSRFLTIDGGNHWLKT